MNMAPHPPHHVPCSHLYCRELAQSLSAHTGSQVVRAHGGRGTGCAPYNVVGGVGGGGGWVVVRVGCWVVRGGWWVMGGECGLLEVGGGECGTVPSL